jgi:hypothetical protein
MEDKKKNQSLEIELKEGVAEGVYSNMTVLAHSPSEFVIDFISVLPGVAKGQVRSRVIMAPEHVKRLMFALQDNVARYESMFGEIEMNGPELSSGLRKMKPRGDA